MRIRKYRLERFRALCEALTPVLLGFAVGLLACLLITLCGCKTREIVREIPVTVTEQHTEYQVREVAVHDTLTMRDSVYHYVMGDTVRIERWHYVEGKSNVLRVDTLVKHDSVPVVTTVTVTEIKEIEKPLSWWQRTLQHLGKAMIALLVAAAGVAVWKKKIG